MPSSASSSRGHRCEQRGRDRHRLRGHAVDGVNRAEHHRIRPVRRARRNQDDRKLPDLVCRSRSRGLGCAPPHRPCGAGPVGLVQRRGRTPHARQRRVRTDHGHHTIDLGNAVDDRRRLLCCPPFGPLRAPGGSSANRPARRPNAPGPSSHLELRPAARLRPSTGSGWRGRGRGTDAARAIPPASPARARSRALRPCRKFVSGSTMRSSSIRLLNAGDAVVVRLDEVRAFAVPPDLDGVRIDGSLTENPVAHPDSGPIRGSVPAPRRTSRR